MHGAFRARLSSIACRRLFRARTRLHLKAGFFLAAIAVLSSCAKPTHPFNGSSTKTLAQLSEHLQVDVVSATTEFAVPTAGGTGMIAGRAAVQAHVDGYRSILESEFSLYPTACFRRARLGELRLCQQLSFNGQARAAIPDFEGRALYLDVSSAGEDGMYLRRALHHEFFHMIDLMDDGSLYQDDQWSRLNPVGFFYGSGGAQGQANLTSGLVTDKYPGFLSLYSTQGVEEDKAEAYSVLVVNSLVFHGLAKLDPVLAQKELAIKRIAKDFCSELDESFWLEAASLKR